MVATHTYPRPIPSPVKDLRPASQTCEQCHWPGRFAGDKLLVRTSYTEDEKNTPQTDVVMLKVGGNNGQGVSGIHGHHLADAARIRYVSTDPQRQTIPAVYYTDDKGKTTEFLSSDAKPTKEQLDRGEHRVMDCLDCHNRPAHASETVSYTHLDVYKRQQGTLRCSAAGNQSCCQRDLDQCHMQRVLQLLA